MLWAPIVGLVAIAEYLFFTSRVGASRAKYGVEAPATTGNPEWECLFRVQQNTLEQLAIFLPSLWIFSVFVSPTIGAAIGVVFVIGRFVYYTGYVKDPDSRGTGFLIGYLPNLALVLGGIAGAILGRSIYTGAVDLAAALALVDEAEGKEAVCS